MKLLAFVLATAVVTVAAVTVFVRLAAQPGCLTHADLDAQRTREEADLAAAWGWLV
jgi:hypothetical protein